MTSDPHTLDEYAATLRELETDERAVAVHVLACKLHGVPAATKMRQATTFALDELVAQGRAEQPYPGRYRATLREELQARIPVSSEGLVAAVQQAAEMIDPTSQPVAPKLPVYFNGVELTERTVTVTVPESEAPKLDETGFVGVALGRELPLNDDEAHLPGCSEVASGPPGAQARPLAGMMRSIDAVASAMSGATSTTPGTPAVAPDTLVSAVNRAAGAGADALLGVSEYPDAILAEAAVFAKRAAKALEIARQDLVRAEAAEKAAVEARQAACRATIAAMQRVARLEQIAGLP